MVKVKRIILIFLIALAMLMLAGNCNATYAVTDVQGKWIAASPYYRDESNYYKYKITGKLMWRVTATSIAGQNYNRNDMIYFLQGNDGINLRNDYPTLSDAYEKIAIKEFGHIPSFKELFGYKSKIAESDIIEMEKRGYVGLLNNHAATRICYKMYFDLKSPNELTKTINQQYASKIPNVNSQNYNSLVWLMNNICIFQDTDDEYSMNGKYKFQDIINMKRQYRSNLLKLAQIYDEDLLEAYNNENDEYINSDINAVQQLAIWYFTNDDEYKVEPEEFENKFTIEKAVWKNKNIPDVNENRIKICKKLYTYLVKEAKNHSGYVTSSETNQAYKIDRSKQISVRNVNNQYHMIGPFRINKVSETPSTLIATFKNGQQTIYNPVLMLLKSNGGKIVKSIEDTIGKDFYILLPLYETVGDITLSISGIYFNVDIKYWAVSSTRTHQIPDDEPYNTAYPIVRSYIIDDDEYKEEVIYKKSNGIFKLSVSDLINSINKVENIIGNVMTATLKEIKNIEVMMAENSHIKQIY